MTPGCFEWKGPVSCETIGSAVGMAPKRSRPVSPLLNSSSPRRMFSEFGQDPLRVLERALPLGGQADKAVAALDQRRAEIVLQQAERGGQRRLRHMAGLRRAAEVLLPRQGDKIFELAKHHSPFPPVGIVTSILGPSQ